jgi:hypothetical protein
VGQRRGLTGGEIGAGLWENPDRDRKALMGVGSLMGFSHNRLSLYRLSLLSRHHRRREMGAQEACNGLEATNVELWTQA